MRDWASFLRVWRISRGLRVLGVRFLWLWRILRGLRISFLRLWRISRGLRVLGVRFLWLWRVSRGLRLWGADCTRLWGTGPSCSTKKGHARSCTWAAGLLRCYVEHTRSWGGWFRAGDLLIRRGILSHSIPI